MSEVRGIDGILAVLLSIMAMITALIAGSLIYYTTRVEVESLREEIESLKGKLVAEGVSPRAGSSERGAVKGHGHVGDAEEIPAGPVTIEYVLKTGRDEGGFYFEGVSGEISGKRNPVLRLRVGEAVKITLVNGDGVTHDLAAPDLGVHLREHVSEIGEEASVIFKADRPGEFSYYCTIPGHRESGMEGLIVITDGHYESSEEDNN